jgi:streptogrisin B
VGEPGVGEPGVGEPGVGEPGVGGHAASHAAAAPAGLSPRVSSGDRVYGNTGISCIAGLNVHSGSTYYLILPGHCTASASAWYTSPTMTSATYIGPSVASSFPGDDYGLVRYDNPAIPHPSTFTGVGNAFVGESVCVKTRTTGTHCGTVTALNQTVNYGQDGIVTGLIRTNVCSEPGDDGAVLYSGTIAIGLLSGGSGNCTSGGTTFFQPLAEVLAAYGLTV